MLLLGEGSEATEPYNKYDKTRPHSILSLQFDQKVRPLSFLPEKFDLFTATRRCGKLVEENGHHGLSCARSARCFSRHHNLNTLVKQALSSIKVSSILEPYGLTRTDGKHPDGITLAPWEEGKQLVWDVTCVDLLAPSRIENGSVANPGTAAEDAEELKTAEYVCLTDKGYIFQPLAFEIQGGVEPSTSTFLKNLCKKLCVCNQENTAGSFFRQRLSLAIQVGNAASVGGTVRDEDHLSELYYL